MIKLKFLTTRVTLDDHRQIFAYSKRRGLSVSDFVRQTVLDAIRDENNDRGQKNNYKGQNIEDTLT